MRWWSREPSEAEKLRQKLRENMLKAKKENDLLILALTEKINRETRGAAPA